MEKMLYVVWKHEADTEAGLQAEAAGQGCSPDH